MGYSGHASGATVITVVTIFTSIAVASTSARLWTRIRIARQPGLDDLMISIAMALSIILNACMVMQVRYGMGRHMDTLTPHELLHSLIWFYVSIPTYNSALGIVKLSVVWQCLRIFGQIDWYRRTSYALLAAIGIFTIWSVFIAIFLCQPIDHFWKPKERGKCLNRLAIWFFTSVYSIITDILTATLPLPVVRKLSMPRKQRILLMCVFALGGIVCVISVFRFHSLYVIAKSKDPTYDNPLAAIWSTMEINIGIIASCLPVLKGFLTRYCPRIFTFLAAGSGGPGYELSAPRGQSMPTLGSTQTPASTHFGRKYGIQVTQIEADEGHAMEVGRLTKSDGIQITTLVEQQEERRVRRGNESFDSRENLAAAAAPYEQP